MKLVILYPVACRTMLLCPSNGEVPGFGSKFPHDFLLKTATLQRRVLLLQVSLLQLKFPQHIKSLNIGSSGGLFTQKNK